jgi:hypothetical protein
VKVGKMIGDVVMILMVGAVFSICGYVLGAYRERHKNDR